MDPDNHDGRQKDSPSLEGQATASSVEQVSVAAHESKNSESSRGSASTKHSSESDDLKSGLMTGVQALPAVTLENSSQPQLLETSHATESSTQSSTRPPLSEGGRVEFDGGLSGKDMTPANTNTELSESRRPKRPNAAPLGHEVFGRAIRVGGSGAFPNIGSQLGPYFFFQTIGKGTFSSIHKCVILESFHSQGVQEEGY